MESPVESRVQGEDSNTAEYSNTLVGLRFRYDAAEMVLYDDSATLASNALTKGSEAALQLRYSGDGGAVMWIIVIRTPAHASKTRQTLADQAWTTALLLDDCARARVKKGTTARVLGARQVGGHRAYVIERRGVVSSGVYEGSPVRYRCVGVVAKRHSLMVIQEVSPSRFTQCFRGFDKVLRTVRLSDAVGV
jgi:hypothetical protein